jgi:hypothetical protein
LGFLAETIAGLDVVERNYWPKATPPSIIDGTWKVPVIEKRN